MKPLLLNIRLIEMIEASNLAGQIEISGGRCVLPTGLEPITIPTVGLAECSSTAKLENKTTIHAVSLKARLCSDLLLIYRRAAYILHTVTGEQYLLGIGEQPHPVLLKSLDMPSSPADPSGWQISINWESPVGLLAIVG